MTDGLSRASSALALFDKNYDAEQMLRQVIVGNPDLNVYGFRHKQVPVHGEDHNWTKYRTEFELCVAWLDACRSVIPCPASRGCYSYIAKHAVEDWQEAVAGGFSWIGNGVLIAAALSLGVPVKREDDSPNCWVGIQSGRLVRARTRWLGTTPAGRFDAIDQELDSVLKIRPVHLPRAFNAVSERGL